MKFVENGPSIPDELLQARDQGRVVFFCGAGVSQAKANLPGFDGLADTVLNSLGATPDSPAVKLLSHAREFDEMTGEAGLISADRIFGLLEREFETRDIESAVAQALAPQKPVNLDAHNTLLDLATTRQGEVRLVTTNFDRLFDACGRELQPWQPPRLPDPSRSSDMNGIVYLHGKATMDYQSSEGDGFVLSSSGFGRAYLSDGWATSFIREIIDRYVVVFVGYAADDPPVHYLLEALNSTSGSLKDVYAFQSGDADTAASKWTHKGVEAIPFVSYSELWETLECWADRARDPDAWLASIIAKAKDGPEKILPHERGQVAHIVSTVEGVREFFKGDEVPPAEWLCVFDPYIRYAIPDYMGDFYNRGPLVNPFDFYSLDSDTPPISDEKDRNSLSRIPPDAWNAFTPNRLDKANLDDGHIASFRGGWPYNSSRLPSRLDQLGIWLAKVSEQPAAAWWTARQKNIHPEIQFRVQQEVNRSMRPSSSVVRAAWRILLESWKDDKDDINRDWYELEAEIKKDGWNRSVVRKYEECTRPYLKVGIPSSNRPKPPIQDEELNLYDLLSLDVAYPEIDQSEDIPDEWLVSIVEAQRKNLEVALNLETEVGGYGLENICSIVPEDGSDIDQHNRSHGLSGRVIAFSKVFEHFIEIDLESALAEFNKWSVDDGTIFTRLQIWSANESKVMSGAQVREFILGLSGDVFWNHGHTRDLLLMLENRWYSMSSDSRAKIEKRLLAGPPRWKDEDDEHLKERSARATLDRVHYLSSNGCRFGFDLELETKRMRADAPKWEKEDAEKVVESREARGGWVGTTTDYLSLLEIPLNSVLSKAKEVSGKQEDFLERKDPFAGLSANEPDRAFSVLIESAKEKEFPDWAWRTFLNSDARKKDKIELIAAIAEQLIQFSDEVHTKIINPISDWLFNISKLLAESHPDVFDRLINRLTKALSGKPEIGLCGMKVNGRVADWSSQAINAPAGKVAEALFNDPRKDGLKANEGFNAEWLKHIQELLVLPDDLHRHALAIFTFNLSWFNFIDPRWTEEKLLHVVEAQDQDDRDAFWSGFFWGNRIPDSGLFMRLKPHFLQLAKEKNIMHEDHASVLPAIILAGWGKVKSSEERCISNAEMREILLHASDDFRSRLLWQLERWSSEEEWPSLIQKLLRDVWPRQMAAKSSKVSGKLCDFVFSQEGSFEDIAVLVLPLLSKIENEYIRLPNLRRKKETVIDLHPRRAFELLYAVLPDDISKWPYKIGEVLERTGEADSDLKGDERFIELIRKWDSR